MKRMERRRYVIIESADVPKALSTLMITRCVAYRCRTIRAMVQPVVEVGVVSEDGFMCCVMVAVYRFAARRAVRNEVAASFYVVLYIVHSSICISVSPKRIYANKAPAAKVAAPRNLALLEIVLVSLMSVTALKPSLSSDF